jgi:hypothetical protein
MDKLHANMNERQALSTEIAKLMEKDAALQAEWFRLAADLPGMPAEASRILRSAVA